MEMKENKRLQSRIEIICKMMNDDPGRHPSAIIATTGSTFQDDLQELYDYCEKTGQYYMAYLLKNHCSLIRDNNEKPPIPEQISLL